MLINSDIYLQQQAPNILGNIQNGLSIRQFLDQNNLQKEQIAKLKATDDAYKAGVIKNEDGSTSFDQNKTLSQLANVGGKEYLEAKNQFQSIDLAKQKAEMEKRLQQLDLTSRLTGAVKDQATYDQAIQTAGQYGLDTSKFPKLYDPNLVKQYQMMSLTAKEQLQNQMDQQKFEFDQQKNAMDNKFKEKDYNYKDKDFTLREKELYSRSADRKATRDEQRFQAGLRGDLIPLDQKKLVENLSSKNANKLSIKNQIESVMSTWDDLSEDQKVATGRSLLKTLNSTEGADAIGSEEANRLGSKLEFALGNLTNSNPLQFGRDLEGFKTQANAAAKNIGVAVDSNQQIVDQAMGRRPQAPKKGGLQTREINGVTYIKVEGGWLPQ